MGHGSLVGAIHICGRVRGAGPVSRSGDARSVHVLCIAGERRSGHGPRREEMNWISIVLQIVPVLLKALEDLHAANPVPPPTPGALSVVWLQHNLNAMGLEPPLTEDGQYGPATDAAVQKLVAKIKASGGL